LKVDLPFFLPLPLLIIIVALLLLS
jgi:hypothetical protein